VDEKEGVSGEKDFEELVDERITRLKVLYEKNKKYYEAIDIVKL